MARGARFFLMALAGIVAMHAARAQVEDEVEEDAAVFEEDDPIDEEAAASVFIAANKVSPPPAGPCVLSMPALAHPVRAGDRGVRRAGRAPGSPDPFVGSRAALAALAAVGPSPSRPARGRLRLRLSRTRQRPCDAPPACTPARAWRSLRAPSSRPSLALGAWATVCALLAALLLPQAIEFGDVPLLVVGKEFTVTYELFNLGNA